MTILFAHLSNIWFILHEGLGRNLWIELQILKTSLCFIDENFSKPVSQSHTIILV